MNPSIEPYRIFFPIGLLHALVGTSVWIGYSFHQNQYPGDTHSYQMSTGFLLNFVFGFLLTAIPRFTKTDLCKKHELATMSFLAITSLFWESYIIVFLQLLTLIAFIFSRFKSNGRSLPPLLIFLPFGILNGIFGTAILALVQLHLISPVHTHTGKTFLFYGCFTYIFLGVGS